MDEKTPYGDFSGVLSIMAAVRKHLRSAPIVEALIDFRVESASDSNAETALLAKDRLHESFPRVAPRYRGQFRFSFNTAADTKTKAESEATPIGYDFSTDDGSRLAQFNIEGFTLNWLKPYTRWEELRDLARHAWDEYVAIFRPTVVTRIGLRYINNLSIPLPLDDFRDYLTASPVVPDNLPQGLGSFLTNVMLVDAQRDANATITQALQGAADNKLSVLLDIDIWRTASLPVGENDMWPALETFRNLKNEAFFGYVTDKLLEQYA